MAEFACSKEPAFAYGFQEGSDRLAFLASEMRDAFVDRRARSKDDNDNK